MMLSTDSNCSFNQTYTPNLPGEEIPQVIRVLYICFLATCLIIGVPGNLLVAGVYSCLDSKSTTDWFILFVSILDSLICCLEVPFFLSFEIANWTININDAVCQIFVWISQALTLSSCILLCLIAVDRLQKICYPFNPSMSPKAAKRASALSLVVSVFLSLPVFFLYGNDKQGECQVLKKHERSLFHGIYFTAIFVAFILMFILVTVSYVMVARRLRHRMLVSQSLLECLAQAKMVQRRPTMHEIISIASTGNTSPPPAITIQITDSSMENSVEDVFQIPSPLACNSRNSFSEQAGRDRYSRIVTPEPNKITFHDQFLLQVPQSRPSSEVELPTGLPYSTDIFTASSLITSNDRVRKDSRNKSASNENTITALVFTVTVVFILSWILPWYIFLYRYYTPDTCSAYRLTSAMVHYGPNLYLLNHFSNPLVYSFMSRSFRDNVKMLVRKVIRTCSKN